MKKRALCVLAMAVSFCLSCLNYGFACYEVPCDFTLTEGQNLQYLNCGNEYLLIFDRWDGDEDFNDNFDGECSPQDIILSRSSSFRAAELGFYKRSTNWATIILPWVNSDEALSLVPKHTLSDFQHIMDCGLEYNGYAMTKRFWSRNDHGCNNHDGDYNGDGNSDGDENGSDGCPQPVPEPASLALLGTGLMGLIGYKFRKE